MLLRTTSRLSGENFWLRKFCLTIISLALVSIQIQAQNGWTNKGNIPTPRAGMTACVIDNKIYVIGGNNGSPNYSDLAVNEVYDPVANTWETKAPLPAPRGFHSSAVVNGIIYVIGGGYFTPTNSLYAYDPATNSWSTKADLLSPRTGAQAGVVNGIIYNIGGNQSERNCEAYNPDSNKWISKTPMPGGGGDVAVTVYNGLIYTFGGSGSGWQQYSNVYAYDPANNSWSQKQYMPTARYALQTYLVGNKIYAIGGGKGNWTSLAKVEVYYPDIDTWVTRADMPFIDYYFAGAVVNDKIYVIGGTPDGATGVLDVWEYDPSQDLTETPVELTSFTAEALDQKVVLKWTTATELNNNGFEVQRKVAESDFATIGFVKGEGTTTNQKEYSYVDKELTDGKYIYRLKQIDYNGSYEYSNVIEVDVRSLDYYALEQNYPNPFNPTTTIGYVLKEKTNTKLILLNAIGEEMAVLVNEEQDKGFHKVDFNAVNLPSGVYFYQLKAGDFISAKKMILLR